MFTDVVLAMGLLLTTATQFRIPRVPIGPGELLLVCWLLMTVLRGLLSREIVVNKAQRRLLLFWLLFAASLSIGTTVAILSNEDFDPQWFLHDAMAYPLIGAVVCLSVAGRNAQAHLDRVAWLFATLGSVSLAVLVAGGQGLTPLPVEPWFWERFRGWSQNPNQLAELCAVLALVSVHLLDVSTRAHSRIAAFLCAVIAIYCGVLTQSDTFRYAMLAAVPLFLLLKLRARLAIPWSAALGLVVMAGAVGALAFVLPIPRPSIGAERAAVVDALSKEGGKDASHEVALRASLWRQAVRRGVFDSWLLGLGPGPHLMIPPEIVAAHYNSMGEDAPGNVVHPKANGTANFEAHNTVLDLFTQGGLLAAGSFLWLLAMASHRAAVCARAGLIALLAGLAVFIVTGNIARTPIMWFGIALCLVAEPRRLRRASQGGRRSSQMSTRRLPHLHYPVSSRLEADAHGAALS